MKRKLIKSLIFFICSTFLFNFYSSFADDIESETIDYKTIETSSVNTTDLNINARSAIVLDRISKKILYGKNENNKVKMASTTKIMTAIIVLENCSDLNELVIISKKSARNRRF